jgi:Uma2 family endonuclease
MTALLELPDRTRHVEEPVRFHWTRDEFYRFFDDPQFNGRKLILMDGDVIEMAIANSPHDIGMTMLDELFKQVKWEEGYVRNQQGLTLGFDTDPIPDYALVPGRPRDYHPNHPTTALMVVEVSDSSLRYDLREKMHLYAASQVPEYWVLDTVGRALHVFTTPVADPSALRGHRYSDHKTLRDTDGWNIRGVSFRIADLLP